MLKWNLMNILVDVWFLSYRLNVLESAGIQEQLHVMNFFFASQFKTWNLDIINF